MKKRKTFLVLIIFAATAFLIFFIVRRYVKREVSYYGNGQLEHEVLTINGKYQGLWTDYFEHGGVRARTHWDDGMLNGSNVFYYKNGVVRQENEYKRNKLLSAKDYAVDGSLEEVRIYDSLERVIDYYSYKKDGSRDFSREKKDPIFIPEGDTLILGHIYPTEIRLGNRQYDYIEVVIGDLRDMYMAKKNPPLPKKDSLTSLLSIKADSIGLRTISGLVIERSTTSDSLDVIPFTHRFYVKKK